MADEGLLTVRNVAERLGLSVRAGAEHLDQPVSGAQVCDLLSFVIANGKSANVWVTVQTHPNIVAVAALGRLSGIIVAGGFDPGDETLDRADEEQIPLLTTAESAYSIAGRLWEAGVR